MLTIYRSNNAETLASLLAAQLRETPPPPFEPVEVVVNTWPTSRWLGEQLAEQLGGIAAHIRYPFPGSQLRRLVQAVLGEESGGGPDPWRATELVWPVLEVLPALAAQPAAAPLAQWLIRRGGSPRELNLARWQLGRSIADALDDYALYRPDLLEQWWQGRDDGSDWQALLVRELRQRLGEKPFALKVREATARLRGHQWQPPGDGPWRSGRLRLFGLSSMAPVQVELLHAVSAHLAVDLYLLTPCPDLWQHCTNRRAALSDAVALRQPLGSDWLSRADGLEARFGRLGAEFQQLLEGTGECQLGSSAYGDLFLDPCTLQPHQGPGDASGRQGSRQPTLLRQLQRQLAEPATTPGLQRTPGDSSLEFHPCPGRWRQVELVRDRILQLLHDDPTLEPRDVLVMTPQVDDFAPLVAAVFGDRDATGVALEWRLTDRSQQSQAGLSRTLLALLRQAGERLTASSLQALLESAPLGERFQLEGEAVTALHRTLQQAGFRWGLDGQERGGECTGSLSWAIDRLLLGLVLPEQPGLAPADTAPFRAPADLEQVGRWLHLLQRLRHWLQQWRQPRPGPAWDSSLKAALADLFSDTGETSWELPQLLEAIDAWQQAAAGCELELAAPVVAAVLEERLAADAGRFGHRSGALTISALEPMRAIPHRVIVLMGLDAGSFPRQRQRPGFHHLERARQLGDPSPADQDRYALLEAVLSARDHLLVTWNCRDERNGEPLQPATPVSQWMVWLRHQLGEQAGELEVIHPANPLDRRNFLASAERPPASCDRRLLAARRRLDAAGSRQPPRQLAATAPPPEGVAAGPQPPADEGCPNAAFEDLRRWAMEPQASWLRGLGLQPREWADLVDDLDAAALDERQRSRLLREALGKAPDASGTPSTPVGLEEPQAWLLGQRGRNLLPPAAGGILEARQLSRRWSDLQAALERLGPARQEPALWDLWASTLAWRGDTLVQVHPARARSRHRLDLWLRLLLAAAAGQGPQAGVLVARGDKGFGEQLRLRPPDIPAAQAELRRLAALRERWRQRCWPVPPDTGWALLTKGRSAAIACWEGGFQRPGEREEPEQALCFGPDLPAAQLLQDPLECCANTLMGPLVEQQT
ncbi:exodeoxyribonuclease V subunit gamma [Cyanobium sp. NIES-981]|uniref:exodeoxyribonuclease V subunit gamma n=1 Tax=Cyanobium sp. NIES-981 TaxID=1851505 RepID=UPI0007DE0DFE|nr:exodeoxyribonuclease V subunit gamma [Cyanobium sp. NIES-981]SBO42868.1 Exodeoxyribonuclease V, gamma subunit [Cyanobium sp. NIES-981]